MADYWCGRVAAVGGGACFRLGFSWDSGWQVYSASPTLPRNMVRCSGVRDELWCVAVFCSLVSTHTHTHTHTLSLSLSLSLCDLREHTGVELFEHEENAYNLHGTASTRDRACFPLPASKLPFTRNTLFCLLFLLKNKQTCFG